MNRLLILLCFSLFHSCQEDYYRPSNVTKVIVEPILVDSTASIRALDFNESYIFYGSSNHIGKQWQNEENKFDTNTLKWISEKNLTKHILTYKNEPLAFRAIKEVNENLFAISIGNPARLYKLSRKSETPKLIYEEQHEKVFYDAMEFWNDQEGIAIGDAIDSCLSIITTRDGGQTWEKLSCADLPPATENEGAFAASDTNIAIVGDKTWVATTAGRIYYSEDKGYTWSVGDTPIVKSKDTEGIYSIDFYDENNGFGIGGDYLKPEGNTANKMRTQDGGKTWQIVGADQEPGYRSCVQYVPNREGKELVALGFNGIDFSNDSGLTWTHLSDEGFYTLRFENDSIAYAAGKGRIAKLTFRE